MNNGMKNVHQKTHTKTRAQKDEHKKTPDPKMGSGVFWIGAVDRNRTDTGSPPTDFESVASASFTTTAFCERMYENYSIDFAKKQVFFQIFLQNRGKHGTISAWTNLFSLTATVC